MTPSIKKQILSIILLCTLFSCDQQKASNTPNDMDSAQIAHSNPVEQTKIDSEDSEKSISALEQQLIDAGLIDIQVFDSTIWVDLKYSSTDNFVGVDVYGDLERCYLQKEVAVRLAHAQIFLHETHPQYNLMVFDGARPLSIQQIFWDTLAKPENIKHLYVADPKVGSIHNYGSAVDLTLCDSQGNALDMGTEYDHFSELAYPSKEEELLAAGQLTSTQIENRKLLRSVMQRAGFTPINTEWWHFNAYSRKRAAELFAIIE